MAHDFFSSLLLSVVLCCVVLCCIGKKQKTKNKKQKTKNKKQNRRKEHKENKIGLYSYWSVKRASLS